MKTSYICSYIIPYSHSRRNLNALKYNINILLQNPMIEIIVVETGKHSFLKNQDMKCKHVFVESKKWNLGWLYNIGTRNTSTDKLFFGEMSLVPTIKTIMAVIQKNTDHGCLYLQDEVVYLNQQQTDKKELPADLKGEEKASHGIVYYKYDDLYKVGTWDESVFSEDLYVLQDKKNTNLISSGKVNGIKTYVFDTDKPKISDEDSARSSKHLEKVMEAEPQSLYKYAISNTKKSSNIHKYTERELMIP